MRSLEFKRTAGAHFRTILFAILLPLFSFSVWPQENPPAEPRSQEISEDDGQPVLIKHLPDWQNVRETTVFTTDLAGLKKAAGDHSDP